MPDPTFTGWLRPTRKHPWAAVCAHPDQWECWKLLIAVRHPGDGLGVEKVVLPTGSDPNTRKELSDATRKPGRGVVGGPDRQASP